MFKFLLALVFVFGLTGCITMPDGTTTPDHEVIEFSAVAGMSVIVGEIETSDEVKVLTYDRLVTLHRTLTCTGNCPPFNLVVLESMIKGALPLEYQALGVQAIRLIKSRAQMYLDPRLPDMENIELIRQIAASVVNGMIMALDPYVAQIKRG